MTNADKFNELAKTGGVCDLRHVGASGSSNFCFDQTDTPDSGTIMACTHGAWSAHVRVNENDAIIMQFIMHPLNDKTWHIMEFTE